MKFSTLIPNLHKGPEKLLRFLVTTAIASIIMIVMLSLFAFYQVFSNLVISSAKDDSVQLCQVLIDQQKQALFQAPPGQEPRLAIHGPALYTLDQSMRKFLAPFGIIKIKIYDNTHTIIYSTEAALIGKSDSDNIRLKNSLSGNIDAKLVNKKKAHDLAEETLLDVDVVETYVPIRNTTNKVLGSIEIYMNVTKYRSEIKTGMLVMTAVLTVVLAGVFGLSYLIIRRGTKQIHDVQSTLETLAITDALTNISNRAHLLSCAEKEFTRFTRSIGTNTASSVLGCMMIDIDHFKVINDTRGHLAGDQILRDVAQRLCLGIRPYDIIGRYGGEEFAVLLPNSSLDQCLAVAERIRASVCDEPFRYNGDEIAISVSLGVSCSSENDRSLSDLLLRADEAMYKAKHNGRNRVSWVYHPFNSELHS